MSGFHVAHVHLSPTQVQKLMRGHNIRLTHANLMKASHPVHLTKRQHNKLMKHKKLGRGMMLQFSPKQVRHHLKHGGSIFSKIGNFFKKTLPQGVSKAFNATKDVVTDPAFQKNFKKYFGYSFHAPATLLRKVPGLEPIGQVSDTLKSIGLGLKRKGRKRRVGAKRVHHARRKRLTA